MKTKEEIIRHLKSEGYTDDASLRIFGFLVGLDIISVKTKLSFRSGKLEFEDFIVWFIVDDVLEVSDLEYGDYVHVCDGCDVLVVTLMEDQQDFVGTNGVEIGCYRLGKDSRMCNDEELAVVQDALHDNGLDFDYALSCLVPLSDDYDENE